MGPECVGFLCYASPSPCLFALICQITLGCKYLVLLSLSKHYILNDDELMSWCRNFPHWQRLVHYLLSSHLESLEDLLFLCLLSEGGCVRINPLVLLYKILLCLASFYVERLLKVSPTLSVSLSLSVCLYLWLAHSLTCTHMYIPYPCDVCLFLLSLYVTHPSEETAWLVLCWLVIA